MGMEQRGYTRTFQPKLSMDSEKREGEKRKGGGRRRGGWDSSLILTDIFCVYQAGVVFHNLLLIC